MWHDTSRRAGGRWLTSVAGVGAAVLVIAGCSGGGGSASPAATKSTGSTTSLLSATTTSTTGPGGTAGTSGGHGDVTVQVDGLDASAAPDLLVARTYEPYTLYHLDHPGGDATLITGAKDSTQPYLLNHLATLVATVVQGDAVNKATVALLDTKTGKQVASVQPDAQQATLIGWSPDGTAVLFTAGSGGPDQHLVLRTDGSSAVLGDDIYLDSSSGTYHVAWVRTKAGATPLALPKDTVEPLQLLSSKNVPVTVASYDSYASDSRAGELTEGGLLPFGGAAAQASVASFNGNGFDGGVGSCPRFGVLSTGGGDPHEFLYDSDTNRTYAIPTTRTDRLRTACPMVSHDGTHVALPGGTTTGVVVVDLTTGKITTVSRQGKPIAWSKDDQKLLVSGGGTFVVAADGSGGKKASIDVPVACVLDSGQVLADVPDPTTQEHELVLYDIDADAGRTLGAGRLDGQPCEISHDGHWLLTSSLLVDLQAGHVGTVSLKSPTGTSVSGTLHFAGPSIVEPLWAAD